MIILPNKGLGVIFITKCASTTIEAGLSGHKGILIGGSAGLKHTTYQRFETHLLPFLKANKIERPHFFAITREPAERLLSWYKFTQRDKIVNALEGSIKNRRYSGNLTFEEYAHNSIEGKTSKYSRVKLQRSFLIGESQKVEVETLIRVENVDEIIPHLFSHFQVSWPSKVKRLNISSIPERATMTDELRKKINESEKFFPDYEIYLRSASTKKELMATLKPN